MAKDIIRYVHATDGTKLAFSSQGEGPALFFLPKFPQSDLEFGSRSPNRRRFYERLAERSQLIRFDYRGTGLSDRDVPPLSVETFVSDILSITAEIGIERFSILSCGKALPIAVRLALAAHKSLTHLILWDAESGPCRLTPAITALASIANDHWDLFLHTLYHMTMSDAEADEVVESAQFSLKPQLFLRAREMWAEADISNELKRICAPTLIMYSRGRRQSAIISTSIAAAIPGARLGLLDGSAAELFNCDVDSAVGTIEEFLGFEQAVFEADDEIDPSVELTSREMETLLLMIDGLRSKEIAAKLAISTHTVERHIANLYRKTGANGRVALTVYSLKRGLVQSRAMAGRT